MKERIRIEAFRVADILHSDKTIIDLHEIIVDNDSRNGVKFFEVFGRNIFEFSRNNVTFGVMNDILAELRSTFRKAGDIDRPE